MELVHNCREAKYFDFLRCLFVAVFFDSTRSFFRYLYFYPGVPSKIHILGFMFLSLCLVYCILKKEVTQYNCIFFTLNYILLSHYFTFNINRFAGFANHHYLMLFSLIITCLYSRKYHEQIVSALMGIFIIFMVNAGLKKVIMGTYYHGEILVWSIKNRDTLQPLFSWIGEAELNRIRNIKTGMGTYATNFIPLLLLSHLSYLAELVVPLLLFIKKIRPQVIFILSFFLISVLLTFRHLGFVGTCFSLLLLYGDKNYFKYLLMGQMVLATIHIFYFYFFPYYEIFR